MTVESRSVVVRLSMEAAQYIRDAQRVGTVTADAMQRVEQSTERASRAQQRSTSQASQAMGLLGFNTETAALAVGTYAVVASANFEQAMSGVQAATHESAAEMELLRDAALEAGAETSFSATQAAAGIENLAKAGISTADILDGGLAGALDLAAAGGLDVASAAEAAAGAMAQFKLEGDQATHVADLLAAGAGKAQGDVSDMVLALKQAGTVSAQTGLSLEETVGSLSALAEQSLLGSDAGTSFKTMLSALTPNSKDAAKAMEQYNIHAFDAQGNFVGMTELAGQLRAGLGDLTDEQRAMALETIFGSDAVRAASIIYDNGAEGIAKWTANVDDAGYAAETAAIKLDNLKGDVEALRGSIETAFIEGGSGDQAALRGITQLATDTVNLTTEAEKADGALGGLFESVTGAINPIGTLGSTYGGLKDALSGSDEKTEDLEKNTDSLAQTAVTAAGGLEAQARAAEGAGEAARQTAADTEAMEKALEEARDVANDTAREFVGFSDSLDDSKVSLGEWITEMAQQAEALENFTENAKKAGKNGLRDGLIEDLKAAGTAGALRMKQLANATDEEIDRANRAWARGEKAVNDYVAATVKVPGSKSTTLDLKAIAAIAGLIEFRNRLDEATKDRIFSITTVYKTVRSASDALPDRTVRQAGGGQVLGPGTTTSDSIPAWLSNKEYVVKAAAVDHYGVGYFDDLNAMRLADGGPTDRNRKRKATGGLDSTMDLSATRGELAAMVQAAVAQENAAAQQAAAARVAAQAAQDQLDAAQKGVESAEQTLRATEQLAQGLRDSVASQFRGALTGGGLAGLSQTLDRDINAGSSMDATLRALAEAGLDTTGASGALYRELAASEDLTTANELLAAGPAAIEEFERKVAERDAINQQRADEVTVQAYGPMIAQQTAAVAIAQAQLDQQKAATAAAEAREWAMVQAFDQLAEQVSELAGEFAERLNDVVPQGRRNG